jgi:hypothetical protein
MASATKTQQQELKLLQIKANALEARIAATSARLDQFGKKLKLLEEQMEKLEERMEKTNAYFSKSFEKPVEKKSVTIHPNMTSLVHDLRMSYISAHLHHEKDEDFLWDLFGSLKEEFPEMENIHFYPYMTGTGVVHLRFTLPTIEFFGFEVTSLEPWKFSLWERSSKAFEECPCFHTINLRFSERATREKLRDPAWVHAFIPDHMKQRLRICNQNANQ